MPRLLRNFQKGEIYHVLQRGVEKRKIFLNKQDYSRFTIALELFNSNEMVNLWPIIARAGGKNGLTKHLQEHRKNVKSRLVDLLAFVLMPNHYHLLIQEIRPHGISRFMQKLGGYATYFNKRYDRVGSLFQSRFKSIGVLDENQLLAVFAYIHTNPVELWESGWKRFSVRAPKDALRQLEEYRWSSYRDYIGKPTFPDTTQREFFHEILNTERERRIAIEDWVQFKAQKRIGNLGSLTLE